VSVWVKVDRGVLAAGIAVVDELDVGALRAAL
jgi:hypothetical protein